MSQSASLIATLTDPPDELDLESLPAAVDWLELRADLAGEIPAAWLRERFSGGLLYTLRSRAEGGGFEGSLPRRRERLSVAARDFDRVDLEAGRDLAEPLLEQVPAHKRVLSWHGRGREKSRLETIFRRMDDVGAALYKLVPLASEAGDEVAPLELLADLQRDDVIAFAAGPSGVWTRFVAPFLGARVLYGAWGRRAGAPGQPGIERICHDYPFPAMPRVEALFGIVGNPVAHSLSPRLHNGAYRVLGIPALYLPFAPSSFADFWLEVVEGGLLPAVGLPIQGLSVTAPYKSAAAAVAGALSPLAQTIDSANTLVVREGVWEGETTDPRGVVAALDAAGVGVRGKRAAVVGCGGAGRAAAAGLSVQGAETVLVNRTPERGREAAGMLQLPFVALQDFDPGGFAIVVHATSAGHEADEALPFDPQGMRKGATLVDLVYDDVPTPLLARARELGVRTVDGREVLLFQALDQFRLMTGRELTAELGRELLGLAAPEVVA